MTCQQCKKKSACRNGKFCGKTCYWESLRTSVKGQKNPHYKERISKTCKTCQKEFLVLPSRMRKNYCSKECGWKRKPTPKEIERKRQIMINRNLVGEKNPSWKGGKTKLRLQIRETKKYYEWRRLVYKRDNYTCTICGFKGYIEAHHIIPFSKILQDNKIKTKKEALELEDLWDINNGQTLCKRCHIKTDSYAKNKR